MSVVFCRRPYTRRENGNAGAVRKAPCTGAVSVGIGILFVNRRRSEVSLPNEPGVTGIRVDGKIRGGTPDVAPEASGMTII